MLVHSVAVIHIELHHRHDSREIRDECAQEPQFIHPPQGAFGIALFQKQIKENAVRLFVAAHCCVNEVQIGRDHPHCIRVQKIACAQRLLKNA